MSSHSRQVCWWGVHEWVAPFLDRVATWPTAGTPSWRSLADRDPVKLAAVLDAGQHWALQVDTRQEAMAEASRAISEAMDWKDFANQIRNRAIVYIPRVKEPV